MIMIGSARAEINPEYCTPAAKGSEYFSVGAGTDGLEASDFPSAPDKPDDSYDGRLRRATSEGSTGSMVVRVPLS
jgi:hypothetical protein